MNLQVVIYFCCWVYVPLWSKFFECFFFFKINQRKKKRNGTKTIYQGIHVHILNSCSFLELLVFRFYSVYHQNWLFIKVYNKKTNNYKTLCNMAFESLTQIVPVVIQKQKIVLTVFQILINCVQFVLHPGFPSYQTRM